MFQFPALASRCAGWCPFRTPGCPIRISADQRLLAPPRGFSQLSPPPPPPGARAPPVPPSLFLNSPSSLHKQGWGNLNPFSFFFFSIMSQTALSFRTYVENNGFRKLPPLVKKGGLSRRVNPLPLGRGRVEVAPSPHYSCKELSPKVVRG